MKRYGPLAVHNAGLVRLGYPPTWADTENEFYKIRNELETKGTSNGDGKR